MSGQRQRILVSVLLESLDGVEMTRAGAHAALALHVQGEMVVHHASGGKWQVQTVTLLPDEEALGRRAVCSEEGHKFGQRQLEKNTFGCQRCDQVFGVIG